jgi:hypothetical protein
MSASIEQATTICELVLLCALVITVSAIGVVRIIILEWRELRRCWQGRRDSQ